MNGRTEIQTNKYIEGRGNKKKRRDKRKYKQINIWKDGKSNKRTDGWKNTQTDGRMEKQTN